MAAEPTIDAALVRLRELLADNDVALLDLVNRRLELVGQIKERKAELGLAFVDPDQACWTTAGQVPSSLLLRSAK